MILKISYSRNWFFRQHFRHFYRLKIPGRQLFSEDYSQTVFSFQIIFPFLFPRLNYVSRKLSDNQIFPLKYVDRQLVSVIVLNFPESTSFSKEFPKAFSRSWERIFPHIFAVKTQFVGEDKLCWKKAWARQYMFSQIRHTIWCHGSTTKSILRMGSSRVIASWENT